MSFPQQRRALTLIETLVVIAILIALLVPAVQKVRAYHVLYDPKIKGPIQSVLTAVRAAKVGDVVELEWVETGHGPAIQSFRLFKKAGEKDAVKGPNDGKPFELKNDKGNAAVTSSLNQNDPLYKNKRHKLFLLNMEAGKTYQIDMTSTALDSYLFLEDPDQKLLAQNDDGGGFPNARIIHKATVTGKHRIVATYFGDGVGEFTLTIRQTDGAPPDDKKDAKDK